MGFKHQVRDKIVGIGADILVSGIDGAQLYQMKPIVGNDSLMQVFNQLPGVKHVQRYSSKAGMIMTSDDFYGMMLKGVGQEYDFTF